MDTSKLTNEELRSIWTAEQIDELNAELSRRLALLTDEVQVWRRWDETDSLSDWQSVEAASDATDAAKEVG